jgi:hypothetical protein
MPPGVCVESIPRGPFNLSQDSPLSSFPVSVEGRGQGRASATETRDLCPIYKLDLNVKNRVPGADDGPLLPPGHPDWSVEDPFEGIGEQRKIPYLDIYACTGGVGDECEENGCLDSGEELSREEQYLKEYNRMYACGKTAALMSTEQFQDYLHRLDCKKPWCKRCGGKGGKIHKARKQAVRRRLNLEAYDLRQFVFTVPEEYRKNFQSRFGLNQLFSAVNRIIKKRFGKECGAVSYVHLFGDKDGSVFNPHINVHVREKCGVRLKVDESFLGGIRTSWKKALIGMGCTGIKLVDVHYSFRIKMTHKAHSVKYMSRPTWDAETLETMNDELKQFLLLDLKGFQYIRFWGELANCNYREDAAGELQEAREHGESLLGEKLFVRAIVHCNIDEMLKRDDIEKVGDGFYRVRKETEQRKAWPV